MISLSTSSINKALDRDASALIALWLQLYGGDPIPARTEVSPAAGLAATALVTQLSAELGTPTLSNVELDARLSRLGLRLGEHQEQMSEEIKLAGGLTCFKGPEGEPGCCVFLPFHVVGGPGNGTDNS